MPKKYHIETTPIPPRFYPVGKYTTIEFREDCAGSCRECVKKKCVYNVFKDNYSHITAMKEPEYLYECMSCFRCVQECTKAIFSRVINPEYRILGDEYWNPDIIHRTWYQAHTGAIPVSGSGYGGRFSGPGYDSIWTDMSEIVRPTRDGIHGREYINTSIELSRRPERLSFNEDMSLAVDVPPIMEVPVPVLFQPPELGIVNENVLKSLVKAASTMGTLMFIRPEIVTDDLKQYGPTLIPCLTKETLGKYQDLVDASVMIELAHEPGIEKEFSRIRKMKENIFISVGVPLNADAASIAIELTKGGVDTVHFYADHHGRELVSKKPMFIKDAIRKIHLALVDASVRQRVNLIVTGGVAMAEHVNKSILCGVDGVVIDYPLLIAMECRLCFSCNKGLPCPVKVGEVDPEYGSARIINLMAAWRNQMLEMLGAMGLREVRRLRGEVGRSLWLEDLENENFAPIFGERKVPFDF